MDLLKVRIVNFRSIKDLTLKMDPKCRILVGINESGKSNILRALSMLEDGILPKPEDIRQSLPDEAPISESSVRFYFSLGKEEIAQVFDKVKDRILSQNNSNKILKCGETEYSLKDFVNRLKEGVYWVDVRESKKYAVYFSLSAEWEVSGDWKKVSVPSGQSAQVVVGGVPKSLSSYKIVCTKEYPDVPEKYLQSLTPEDINGYVGNALTGVVTESLPDVVFWKYTEKNLLPASIHAANFAASPESCLPLQNMFRLAQLEDIGKEINSALSGPPNAFRNLLLKVATHTTKHFKKVWKEYAKVKFLLEEHGQNIRIGISEENYWPMEQRSDGFKRFISFLLQISVNAKLGNLKDTLLIVDEPDVNLHISGARYLRDELIKISNTNHVVYATHSIFMMDTENIGRHVIVSKQDEITDIKDADISNVVDEEVLNNAVGFTIYDVLQKNNILFEGWRDKELFQKSLLMEDLSPETKKYFEEFGCTFAKGVKDVKNVVAFLELAKRVCVIISDSDSVARERQAEHLKTKRFGDWLRYDEVLKDNGVVTCEDLLDPNYVNSVLDQLRKSYPVIGTVVNKAGWMKGLSDALSKAGVDAGAVTEIQSKFKDKLFSELKPQQVNSKYMALPGLLCIT